MIEIKYLYRKIFKPGVESTFRCRSCIFNNCLVDNISKSSTEKVFFQRFRNF